MKNLADNHWAKSCEGEGRIEWCCSICREYFQNGGKRKALEKDKKRAVLATKTTPALNTHEQSKLEGHLTNLNFTNSEIITELLQTSGKIRLLDVGSCFNPFMKFEEFLTVGIDIVPAVESVYKCDFLNLQLQQPLQLAQDAIDAFLKQLKNPIDSLPGELFHVVVFSLLLSYFPSPYQRWICCKKAHELLMLNGLLLIITPDSSHQNRHAMMMKSWKIAIESLGFKRFKYSKFSHMHLMAFRKISLKTTSDLECRSSFAVSTAVARSRPPQVVPTLSVCGGSKARFLSALVKSVLSAGRHRDWSIAWLTAAQDLETSESLVKLSPGLNGCKGSSDR
ncbi:PREDICTED: probable methyltransferase BTM2 homolog [Myotis brandtii]|uniref:probable methyltransferase BTM2 homolog n=1 Tax=Myotis brandtii TaxID=109478 RepID=UPI000704504A|nr:PREDICTED: probable methyltransferase BTM2 homolog [Myotis brandtii]